MQGEIQKNLWISLSGLFDLGLCKVLHFLLYCHEKLLCVFCDMTSFLPFMQIIRGLLLSFDVINHDANMFWLGYQTCCDSSQAYRLYESLHALNF